MTFPTLIAPYADGAHFSVKAPGLWATTVLPIPTESIKGVVSVVNPVSQSLATESLVVVTWN
jgi:hypothetical protein